MRLATTLVVTFALCGPVVSVGAQNAPAPNERSLVSGIGSKADRFAVDSGAPVRESVPAASPRSVAGAPMAGLRAGVHARETSRPDQPLAAATRAGLGQARAMMVVGVAALIAGAIIGGTPGTVVMVGGAVIGLIGLYDYLQ